MKKPFFMRSFIFILSIFTPSMYAMVQYGDYSTEDYTQAIGNLQAIDDLDENLKKLFNLYVTLNLVDHAQTADNILILPSNLQNLQASDLKCLSKKILLEHILPLSREIEKECYKKTFSIARRAKKRSKGIIDQRKTQS